MKRPILITAVLVLISTFVLSSCTWKKSESAETSKSPIEGTENPDYRSGATVVEDLESASGGIERVTVSSGAVLGLGTAINSEKKQDCEKLKTPADVQICKDIIFFKIGTEEHDYAACDNISRLRNRQICISRVSKYLSDFGSCTDIRDEDMKKICFTKWKETEMKMVEQTAASYQKGQQKLIEASKAGTSKERVTLTCSGLSGANRNYCYGAKVNEEIQKTGDTTLCSIIPDAITKAACEQKASAQTNKALLDKAIATKDSTLCEGLVLQQDKDLCKKIVAG